MPLTAVEATEQTGIAYVGLVVQVPATAHAPRRKLRKRLGLVRERLVRLRVEEAIVGVEEGEEVVLRVLTTDSGCGIDYPFVEGDEWLFFTTGDYRITQCSPDRPVNPQDLAVLRRRFGQ